MLRSFVTIIFGQSAHLNLPGVAIGGYRTEFSQLYPDPSQREREGFPVSLTTLGAFPVPPSIIREDIIRFFDKFKLEDEDVIVQYSATFRPQCWWVRFHTKEDREIVKHFKDARLGGRRIVIEEKNMREWKNGTYNHLVGRSLGSAILLTRLANQTTSDDIVSFFRNFHLQGNGVTILQDPLRPNFDEQDQFKRAIVRLVSKQEAQRAFESLTVARKS